MLFVSMFYGQRTTIGFYSGSSVGYNSIYGVNTPNTDLLDFNYNSDLTFFENISVMNDGDLSNFEFFNGSVFGIRVNLPVIRGISIQPEIEYQQLDFNHILYQNGTGVFNNLNFGLSGLEIDGEYKIANYFWRTHSVSFPFVVKLYPTKNLFFQLGAKFGFLVRAEESRTLAKFNIGDEYVDYERISWERTVYDFFDSNSIEDNHGFDINQWPFNWNTSLLMGLGFETKSFYFSLRYNLGLLNFFKEIDNKDDDFFDNYNLEIDTQIYHSFDPITPTVNNNFKLHTIHISIGYHISD